MTKTISVLEIVNVEKEICGTFTVAPQAAKVWPPYVIHV